MKEIADNTLSILKTATGDLEVVVAFDQFPQAKTAANISDWLRTAHTRSGLKPDFILCHATDGASNAVGSALEFQAVTASVRQRDIRHYVCFAHQVNRSAKFASGMGDFAENKNEELSKLLRKTHDINSRIYRNETRLKVLYAVQREKKTGTC
jgi:hypothetical protein